MFREKSQLNEEDNIVVSISIVNDARITELHKKYKKKEGPTDVLSFAADEKFEDDYLLGDIVVNKDQASRQAGEYGNTTEEEIAELVAHGILHLLGVHHDGDAH